MNSVFITHKISLDRFSSNLVNAPNNSTPGDCNSLSTLFESVLDAHALENKRTVRKNQKLHMNKMLRKAIGLRSSMKTKQIRLVIFIFQVYIENIAIQVVQWNYQAKKNSTFWILETLQIFGNRLNPWLPKLHIYTKALFWVITVTLLKIKSIFPKSSIVNKVDNLIITLWKPFSDEVRSTDSSIDWRVRKHRNYPSIQIGKKVSQMGLHINSVEYLGILILKKVLVNLFS